MSERKPTDKAMPTQTDGSMAPRLSEGELVLYATEDGLSQLYLRAEDGTVWLTQAELAELFQTSKQNISLHIKKILAEGEQTESTIKFYLTVQTEGERRVRRKVYLYELDMILAVGYRLAQKLRGGHCAKGGARTRREVAGSLGRCDHRHRAPSGQ